MTTETTEATEMTRDGCNVSMNAYDCEASPRSGLTVRTKCYRCGQFACKKCSRLVGRIRLCNDCQEQDASDDRRRSAATARRPRDAGARPTVYVASKTTHAPRWNRLRAHGLPVLSTWIDEAGVGETSDFTDLWIRCVQEAAEADVLICYREPGEVHKGALVEVGAALASGTPVLAVGCDEFSFVNHPLVTCFPSIEDALAHVARMPVARMPLALAPAALRSAPINVGDWWADADGEAWIITDVTSVTSRHFQARNWRGRHAGSFILSDCIEDGWTRLDGPPEPPVGVMYVITNVDGQPEVWHHQADDLHYCAGSSGGTPWADACSLYTRDLLATLQIVYPLGES